MRKLLRNGAGILFTISCVVFVGMLVYQLLMVSDLAQASASGVYQGPQPPLWITIIGALIGALSAAAIPFFGACVIDRVDRFLTRREAAE